MQSANFSTALAAVASSTIAMVLTHLEGSHPFVELYGKSRVITITWVGFQ